ncbi:MAG: PKD domain-containing protein [Nitrospirota bacterium]
MIRLTKSMLLSGILFYCLVLGGVIPSYAQDASIVRATQVDGTVTKNGIPLKEGDLIQRDDKIATKEKSAAILTWSNGSIVEIYPETSLILKGITFEGDNKLERTLLALERGRIFVKAQVPEHIFSHFEINVSNVPLITQGAEFALKYDEAEKKFTVWSLIGRVIAEMGTNRVRIEEGQQAVLRVGGSPETPVQIAAGTKEALMKTSKRLGGSLLIEEETISTGGLLKVKIGGVKNRRGDFPYTVKFKAIIGGGSGKIKSIQWDFGDGKSAEGKEVQHTFTQGVYIVVLRVEDENGQKATSQISISVEEACAC